jgi:NADH dehydrogenase
VLAVRPRLYEADPGSMAFELRPTLQTAGVAFHAGEAAAVDLAASRLELVDGPAMAFDRLVIATGSRMAAPDVAGIEHAFSIDTVEEAVRFDARLREVAALPQPAIVVIGGGFAGIELALELRPRARQMFGAEAGQRLRIHVVDRAAEIGSALGPRLRPSIEAAMRVGDVRWHLGESVLRINDRSVELRDGQHLRSDATVLCVGLRAAPFTLCLPFERAADGRLVVDAHLRAAPGAPVFAAGDAARWLRPATSPCCRASMHSAWARLPARTRYVTYADIRCCNMRSRTT